MEQSQEPGDGKAAPRPLLRRLAEGSLQGRGIGHGAARAIDQKRTMALPSPVVQGESLHRAAEALQQEVKEAQGQEFTPEDIAHISPLAYRHVIVNGTYDFSPPHTSNLQDQLCV